MRTIYIDSNYICHAENAEGRTAVETDILDGISNFALPCFKFIPAHDDKVDFCQCINSEMADAIQAQFLADNELLNIIDGTTSVEEESEAEV